MHIHVVPNRAAAPTVLLRESFREGAQVRKRTLANLSSWSTAQIDAMRALLRGEDVRPVAQLFEITASRAHGQVQAVAIAMERLGVASLLASKPSSERDVVLAMVAARVVAPHTKLATTRWWHTTTLADDFGVADATEDGCYAAMDWLLARARTASSRNWPRAISRTAGWCSTICRRVTSKGRTVPSPGAATAATANAGRSR